MKKGKIKRVTVSTRIREDHLLALKDALREFNYQNKDLEDISISRFFEDRIVEWIEQFPDFKNRAKKLRQISKKKNTRVYVRKMRGSELLSYAKKHGYIGAKCNRCPFGHFIPNPSDKNSGRCEWTFREVYYNKRLGGWENNCTNDEVLKMMKEGKMDEIIEEVEMDDDIEIVIVNGKQTYKRKDKKNKSSKKPMLSYIKKEYETDDMCGNIPERFFVPESKELDWDTFRGIKIGEKAQSIKNGEIHTVKRFYIKKGKMMIEFEDNTQDWVKNYVPYNDFVPEDFVPNEFVVDDSWGF